MQKLDSVQMFVQMLQVQVRLRVALASGIRFAQASVRVSPSVRVQESKLVVEAERLPGEISQVQVASVGSFAGAHCSHAGGIALPARFQPFR